jgi:fructose-bisphosphate aldolase class 1
VLIEWVEVWSSSGGLEQLPAAAVVAWPQLPCSCSHHCTNHATNQQGKPENIKAGQDALLKRAKANSEAQLGKYNPSGESAESASTLYEKGYKY